MRGSAQDDSSGKLDGEEQLQSYMEGLPPGTMKMRRSSDVPRGLGSCFALSQGSVRRGGLHPGLFSCVRSGERSLWPSILRWLSRNLFSGPVLRSAQDDKVERRVLRSGQDDSSTLDDSGKLVTEKKNASEGNSQQLDVLCHAAWHSLGWLFIANVIGVWLAVCLLYPSAGAWLRDWSYGRWMPVHLNFLLYGWMALPLVAWAMRIYGADRSWVAVWSRAALLVWSLALTIGGVSWLQGSSSGKLFLDWSGFARILFPLAILFVWFVLVVSYVRGWRDVENRGLSVRAVKVFGLLLLLLIPF